MTFKVGDRVRGRVAGCCGTVQGFTKDGLLIVEVGSNDIRAWADDDAVEKLPPDPEQVVRWVYLWSGGEATTSSVNAAPEFHDGYSIGGNKLLARTRVVLKPGQFDDENTPGEWNAALDAACSRLGRWPTPGSVNQSVKDECIGLIRALKRSAP